MTFLKKADFSVNINPTTFKNIHYSISNDFDEILQKAKLLD